MEKIILQIADGTKMAAYLSRPKNKTTNVIILMQEAFGVNHHIQNVAKIFSDQGYLVIAPELYHRTAPEGFTCGYNEFNLALPHLSALTHLGMQQDAQACYDWLSESENSKSFAAVGYCMGGRAAYVANASVPLSCAVSYYGGRIATSSLSLAADQKSPILFFWGGLDQHIPSEQIQSVNQELKKAEKDFSSVEIAKADHGFFCDERPAYNPAAARQSWALTIQFLKDHLTTP
jgi:carboxymethylenebutenolidase